MSKLQKSKQNVAKCTKKFKKQGLYHITSYVECISFFELNVKNHLHLFPKNAYLYTNYIVFKVKVNDF